MPLYILITAIGLYLRIAASAIEPEPDWAKRYAAVKQEALAKFIQPSIGTQITLARRVGSSIHGRLDGIGKDTVTVDGTAYSASILTPDTSARIFPDAYAIKFASDQLRTEQMQYKQRKLAEDDAARAEQQRIDKQQEAEAKARIEEEIRSRLEFKGLRLGMTPAEVSMLTQSTEWNFMFPVRSGTQQEPIFLNWDNNASISFRTIVSKGPEGHKSYYGWRYAFTKFADNRIYSIEVSGPEWTADYIDTSLKDWLKMAYSALIEKYGKPTETLLPIEDINIFSFKPGYGVFLYKWVVNDQRISLTIGSYESEYYGSIDYLDLKVQKNMNDNTKVEINL